MQHVTTPAIAPTTADTIAFLGGTLRIEEEITPEARLFSSGLLDSVAMVRLIGFVEDTTGRQVPPHEVTLENFDTADRIAAYCSRSG